LILRERFHLKELVGMGLAILGAVTVVFSSSQSNPRVGLAHHPTTSFPRISRGNDLGPSAETS
jgi:drug/metabolite transporter (DMT)-like permease